MNKKISKIFAVVLVVMLVATSMIVPTFAETTYYCSVCKENGVKGALKHTIEATCGDNGYEIYECDYVDEDSKNCTGTITLVVNATGEHVSNDTLVKKVDATCEKPGNVAYENCKFCGQELDPETGNEIDDIVIKATKHNYNEVVTDPECEEDGYTTYTCKNTWCDVEGGHTYVDDETDALDHDFSVDVPEKAATCRTEGYTDHVKCSRCDEIDPENPKTILPIEDHGAYLDEYEAPTCTEVGYNIFKCTKEGCPYKDGVREELAALKHDLENHPAKAATCEKEGWNAYVTCKRADCDYSTYAEKNPTGNKPALGHTTVNKGYLAPNCTESGLTDAVVCDRPECDEYNAELGYGKVHHAGETIAALGHTLTDVGAKAADCTTAGNIAHKKCTVCTKLFAATATGAATDVAITAESVVIDALKHDYKIWVQDSTCTEVGYKIYTCVREVSEGVECEHTYSEEIAAKGHTLTDVKEVAATCKGEGQTGTKAHKKCTVKECGKLFATTATGAATDKAVEASSLVIAIPEHVEQAVAAVNPTYNAAGNTAGTKCANCGDFLANTTKLNELKEAVKFHYELVGVNGSATAVNSGYVTLKVYFDVLADEENDKEEYNSDVLANIFGVDFAMTYDSSVFTLTNVIASNDFTKAEFTPFKTANDNGKVAITQDMVNVSKEFRGEDNLFATLTFQVAKNAPVAKYAFALDNILVVHPEADEKTVDASASEAEVKINVKALGDANGDTVYNSVDSLAVSNYIKNPSVDKEYVAEYDMNKDGVIDFIDLDLLRKAIVGNTEYLDIIVDPNAVTPEV